MNEMERHHFTNNQSTLQNRTQNRVRKRVATQADLEAGHLKATVENCVRDGINAGLQQALLQHQPTLAQPQQQASGQQSAIDTIVRNQIAAATIRHRSAAIADGRQYPLMGTTCAAASQIAAQMPPALTQPFPSCQLHGAKMQPSFAIGPQHSAEASTIAAAVLAGTDPCRMMQQQAALATMEGQLNPNYAIGDQSTWPRGSCQALLPPALCQHRW